MIEEPSSHEAIACSLRLLSIRNHSRKELAGKLLKKGFRQDAVEAAISYLDKKKLLDDEAFGKEFISSRSKRRPIGERSMRLELTRKGIPDDLAGDLLSEYDSSELCRVAAEKKLISLKRYDPSQQKKKLESFLRNRGFEWLVIKETIEHLFKNQPS
ncbi:MAG: recombination regulator RecX [Chlorobiaceae bacterium]|nr:recombination regulator RecX [Chlorobiaceae bacterium]